MTNRQARRLVITRFLQLPYFYLNISMRLFITCAMTLVCASLWAESARVDADTYLRARQSRERFGLRGNTFNCAVQPRWIGSTHTFWYVHENADGSWQYMLVDADRRTKRQLTDHGRLARALGLDSGGRITLDGLRPSAGGDTLWFNRDGHRWQYTSRRGVLTDLGAIPPSPTLPHWMVVDPETDTEPVTSPDGRMEAMVRGHNVVVRDRASGAVRALTTDGTIGCYYSSRLQWSPDSRQIATCKIRPVEKRYVHYVESCPADELQPRLHRQEYAKPGDELRQKLPVVVRADGSGVTVPADCTLIANQYDLYGPEWSADSRAIRFHYNGRGHKAYRVMEMDAFGGGLRTIVDETHPKYVNYSRIYSHMFDHGRRMLWTSERDNYNHLYVVDCATGQMRQLTFGPWYVREIVKVDEASGWVYFTANGVDADEDPYFKKFYRVNIETGEMTHLSPTPGTHSGALSADGRYLADTYSAISKAPVTVVRDCADGSVVMTVAEGDISGLEANGWRAPETFAAPGRDGSTLMWGLIYRPSDFDPSKRYPVVEYIYQGPGDHYVPKSFQPWNGWMTSLSELGFIVVMVDGMGTSYRSREFENFCYKNLADAGLPDHMAWIRAAAARYPEIDLERVGIFGCSAGGQESTAAVLRYPDFYKAAYSACGCHDNRMDKIWWNEQWLGYPVDSSYVEASNVEHAHLLRRPLMLVVGEIDDNVDPASTIQLAGALIKAHKDFELVVLPGARHTMGDAYGEHKRWDFFVRHLMGATPPGWDEVEGSM